MACDCIKKWEEKAKELIKEKKMYKKPVTDVQMTGTVFPIKDLTLVGRRTESTLEITLEGQKKKKTLGIIHTFCPFCGEKYEKEENA